MRLILTRQVFSSKSTEGTLSINGQNWTCFTLEDTDRGLTKDMPLEDIQHYKVPGETAIPYGEYQLVVNLSHRFQKMMFQICDVPGFDGIRIHAGNRPEDTEGCLLVGKERGADSVTDSRAALAELYELVCNPDLTMKEPTTILIQKAGFTRKVMD